MAGFLGFEPSEVLENTHEDNRDNTIVSQICENCPLKDIAVVFDPNNSAIDTKVKEYQNTEELKLPKISGESKWTFDGIVDAYDRKYGDEELAQLLVVLSPESGIGLGYQVITQEHLFERYDINYEKKEIYLDNDEYLSNFTNDEAAEALHDAVADIIKHIAYEKEGFWGATWRITKGGVITVLGGFEVVVGAIGVVTPEPSTTAAGALVLTYGASTMGEGISMIFGANNGEGYNILEEGFAAVGELSGGDTGENLARRAFLFTNLIVSLGGSYKILKVPDKSFFMKGTYTGHNFAKYHEAGYSVGRLQLAYPFGREGGDLGYVYVNIANNSSDWFFRIEKVIKTTNSSGTGIRINGRLMGLKNWHRSKPKDVLKLLTNLALKRNAIFVKSFKK